MRAASVAFFVVLAGAGLALVPAPVRAAGDVELPRQVPAAKLTQQVGLTEIAIEYDCPAVKGRKIWGGVVPYDRPWTIGANPAAKIKFNRDVTIGDKSVPAGSYWLLAIPGKSAWTVILNKSPETIASARSYRPELDVARVRVSPKGAAHRERLTFTFSEITDDRASLDLEWEALRVSLPIGVNTTQQILTSIGDLDGTWRSFANAARYMLETRKDYDAGLKYVDQALALKEDWYCMWVKAALLAAKGQFGQAREWAEKARDLSNKVGGDTTLEPELKKAIAEWTQKSQRFEKEGRPAAKVGVTSPDDGASDPSPSSPPPFKPATTTAPPPAPVGDPPILRRARLRRR
jgi:Protein of unknown function (DUF2911)